jgi:hypothetical protein
MPACYANWARASTVPVITPICNKKSPKIAWEFFIQGHFFKVEVFNGPGALLSQPFILFVSPPGDVDENYNFPGY